MDVLLFLTKALFDLYIFVVLLRILLPLVRADFRNPMSRFVVLATQPILAPLRRLLPGVGGIDWASVVLVVVLEALVISLIGLMVTGGLLPALPVLLYSLARAALGLLNLYFFLILVQVISSWVAQPGYNPILELVRRLTAPLMEPVQRLIPPLGGLDISPIFVIIAIQALKMLIIGRLLPPVFA